MSESTEAEMVGVETAIGSVRDIRLSADEITEALGQAMLLKHSKYDTAICTLHVSPDGKFSAVVELATAQPTEY